MLAEHRIELELESTSEYYVSSFRTQRQLQSATYQVPGNAIGSQ